MDNPVTTQGIKDSLENEEDSIIIANNIYNFHKIHEQYLKKQESRNSPESSRKKSQLYKK